MSKAIGLSQSKLQKVRLENIGFIFHGFNLFPALTAQENVENFRMDLDERDVAKTALRFSWRVSIKQMKSNANPKSEIQNPKSL
jgi:ABC-type lipoprotein export system ATPase subunit